MAKRPGVYFNYQESIRHGLLLQRRCRAPRLLWARRRFPSWLALFAVGIACLFALPEWRGETSPWGCVLPCHTSAKRQPVPGHRSAQVVAPQEVTLGILAWLKPSGIWVVSLGDPSMERAVLAARAHGTKVFPNLGAAPGQSQALGAVGSGVLHHIPLALVRCKLQLEEFLASPLPGSKCC